jgi:hypothetical protein
VRFLVCTRQIMFVADAAADSKRGTAFAVELRRRTDAIGTAVGEALLPELIRLIAEYLPPALRFDPNLKSSSLIIVDADAEGYGREVRYEKVERSGKFAFKLHTAVTSLPLGQAFGGVTTGRVSWCVQLLSGPFGNIGVVDGESAIPTHRRSFVSIDVCGLRVFDFHGRCWYDCDEDGVYTESISEWPPPPITVTADLTAETLSFAVEQKTFKRIISVPGLATAHAAISVPAVGSARLLDAD